MAHPARPTPFQLLIAVGFLTCWSSITSAADFRVPLMEKAPVLDGSVDPAEWRNAFRIDGFSGEGKRDPRRVSGYVGADRAHLYLAFVSQLPEDGELLEQVDRDTENLVFDDSVEVWLDPAPRDPSDKTVGGRCFQMLANARNHQWFKQHVSGSSVEDPQWTGADWKVVNGIHDRTWHCEIAIPIDSVEKGREATAGAWGINLCRDWKEPWGFSSLGGGPFKPTDRFYFTADAPAIAFGSQSGADGKIDESITISNPTGKPVTVDATMTLARDLMPTENAHERLEIPAGGQKQLAIALTDKVTHAFTLDASVVGADGAALASRHAVWSFAGPWRWTSVKKAVTPMDLRFAYYPYRNLMRLMADVSNLPPKAHLDRLTATVRKRGGGAVIASATFDHLVDHRQEIELKLPELKGEYEIALHATGDGVPTEDVVKPFERTVFPWEHLGLGKSAVYPPFTTITVTGSTIGTVLREHRISGAGLWDQVTATGQPLLAAPMRYRASIDGADAPIVADTIAWSSVAADVVKGAGGFHAGALRAQSALTIDYDGTMRVDLTLLPTDGKRVDSLILDIPMPEAAATYMHAMGDGIRNTISAKVPAGTGTVWTAAKVGANDLPKNFCTYCYLGTPKRGLCWFAENDRGWGWNPQTPNLEIVRENQQVILRIHLIDEPQAIAQKRTLTFGLLAAPVKPRSVEDWRQKWRRDSYTVMGTDINWLALGDCASLYPAGRDLYLWEMIKRGNHEHLGQADIEAVVTRGRPYYEPYGKDIVSLFEHHARHNLVARYGTKMVFYYNRATYQAAEESETFKDEWSQADFRTQDKGISRDEVKIVPSDSYIDQALYWYGKSFDIGGNQGVYWDNWFFAGSYNTAMTGAYHRADGTVIPSTGIWGLRDLCKRTFQYMNERKMPAVTMPHMTSTCILPMLSFATVQYDWEWHYSEGDVQYRFPREYLLMASDGELAGTWPVILGDQGKLADDRWTCRTFVGVAMLHELDCSYPNWNETGKMQHALLKPVDDILAEPGVQAWRYWDDHPQPATSDSADLPTIVYAVPGKHAVIAVVSYAEQDRDDKLTIDAKALGLSGEYTVTDAENGTVIPVSANVVTLPIKKHDVRVLTVTGK